MSETTKPSETTVIGADSHFNGELSFEKSARIDGKFEGQITGKGELEVSQDATCKADITAQSVQVGGEVDGNVKVQGAVRLNSGGVVKGDITADKLVMAEGAKLFGHVSIGDGGGAQTQESTQAVGQASNQANATQEVAPEQTDNNQSASSRYAASFPTYGSYRKNK